MKFIAVSALVATAAASGVATAPTANYVQPQPQRVEIAPVPVCDDKTPYDPTSGCVEVSYKEPGFKCPAGYKKRNDGCETTQYGQSTSVCPKGSFLDKNRCVTEIFAPVDVDCNKGELTDDGCLVRSEPVVIPAKHAGFNYSCDKGFVLEKDICVREVAASASLECDDPNAKLVGSACVVYDYRDMECTKGYVRQGDICEAVSTVPVEMVCPQGSFASEDTCLVQTTAAPVVVCEKGYELNPKSGVCEARVLLQAIMPGSKGGEVPVDCRLGQLDAEGNCYQIHTTSATTICDDGFELDAKNNRCYAYVELEHVATCPKGFEMHGDQCINVATKAPTCPAGYIPEISTVDKGYEKGECVRAIASTSSYICPEGYNLAGSKGKGKKVSSSCTAVETAPAYTSCPKGYDLTESGCVIPGWVEAGKDKFYSPNYSCPKGFSMDKKSMTCTDTQVQTPMVACEKGYELVGHRCTATFHVPAQLICPRGYTHATEEGNLCQKVSYNRPKFVCPKGTISSGKRCFIEGEADSIVLTDSTKGFRKA